MIVQNSKAGWAESKGRNEIDMFFDVVPNDPEEAKHLESLVTDEEHFEAVAVFAGGALKIRVNSRRDTTLEEQAAAKAAADKAADDKAAAQQKAAADAAASQAAADAKESARLAAIAAAIAKGMKDSGAF